MAAATTHRPPGHPCDDQCGRATGSPAACRCACRGRNHGSYLAPAGSVPRRMADPLAGLPANDDQEW